jgi:hypothetical protein
MRKYLNDKTHQIETNNKNNTGDLYRGINESQRAANGELRWQSLK